MVAMKVELRFNKVLYNRAPTLGSVLGAGVLC